MERQPSPAPARDNRQPCAGGPRLPGRRAVTGFCRMRIPMTDRRRRTRTVLAAFRSRSSCTRPNGCRGDRAAQHHRPAGRGRPDFISVTYGANGSSRTSSLDVLQLHPAGTPASSRWRTSPVSAPRTPRPTSLIREFLDAGVTQLPRPARRPAGGRHRRASVPRRPGSAGELVQLIHRVQAERVPYSRGT